MILIVNKNVNVLISPSFHLLYVSWQNASSVVYFITTGNCKHFEDAENVFFFLHSFLKKRDRLFPFFQLVGSPLHSLLANVFHLAQTADLGKDMGKNEYFPSFYFFSATFIASFFSVSPLKFDHCAQFSITLSSSLECERTIILRALALNLTWPASNG